MTIDEAIPVLIEIEEGANAGKEYKDRDALKLGIEALKREQSNRADPDYVVCGQLPGETEE